MIINQVIDLLIEADLSKKKAMGNFWITKTICFKINLLVPKNLDLHLSVTHRHIYRKLDVQLRCATHGSV